MRNKAHTHTLIAQKLLKTNKHDYNYNKYYCCYVWEIQCKEPNG